MVAVRIPGADNIQDVAVARDPGVRADPSDFGADIGTGMQHLGNAAVSLGAHLYQKRQAAQDEVYSSTYDVNANPALTQTVLDTKKQFPDGGPGFMEALQQNLDKTHADVTAKLSQNGLQPSEGAASTVAKRFNALKADYLVKGVVIANNEKVAGLQTQLNDNVDAVKSSVLSGSISLDDALKTVETNAASGKGLYSASQLVEQKDKWQQGVIDAAIRNRYNSGDKAGGDALTQKYYGGVPKYGDSKAPAVQTAMDYFISTGKTKEQAAGIVGNLTHESDFNTSASGDNGTAFGIAQWRGERLAALGAYAASKGKPIGDLQTQLEFVNKELNSTEGAAHRRLLEAKTTKDAALAFIDYERPQGVGTANPHGLGNRLQQAENAARGTYSGGKPTKVASAEGDVAIPGQGKPNADASGDTAASSSGDSAPVLPNVEKALYWRQQSHAVDIDQKQAAERQAAAAKAASDARELDVFKDIHSSEPKMSAVQILDDQYLTKDAKEKLYNIKATTTGGDKADKTYGPGFYALYQQIHAADNDPNRVTDPASLYSHVGPNGDLTVAGVDKLVTEIQGRKTPEGVSEGEMKAQFFKTAKAQISGSDEGLHIHDPKGDQLYLKFMAQALPAYDAGRKAGKSAVQLLNPDSPDYVGKSIDQFKRPMDQWFSDVVSGGAKAAPVSQEFDVKQVKSLDDLTAAYRAGKVTRAIASELAVSKGWATASPAPAVAVPVSR